MADNERIIHQLVNSLSEAIEKGINASKLADCFNESLSSREYSEQQSILFNTILLANTLSSEATRCLHNLSGQREKTMMDLCCKLAAQQAAPQQETATPKQQMFTTSEVMRIANIKGKNTLNKYLKNGTIKGSQNPNSGRWIVKRQDLADYLGTDEF